MKKVADLYVRVSTDEQANTGYSQRHQEEMLRKYCDINSIQVRKVIFEDHSAKNFNRPEWCKMLTEYKKHKGLIDCVLFLKWDRFSRNAADSYAMIATLNKLGIEPQAIEQPLDLTIPENKLMLAFFLAAPEVENARRALNIKGGMLRALKEGRFMGLAPIGYSNKVYENGRKYIAPQEPEASIIRWVFEQLASEKCSLTDLWQQARSKGLQCGKTNFWHIVSNPVYIGKILVPQYKQEEARLVQGLHEPIISEELFYSVQDTLFGRKKPITVKQTVREEFPLRNFLICPKCGRPVTASRSKGRTQYYHYYHCVSVCGWRFKAEHINETFVQELRRYKPRLAMLSLYKQVITDLYRQEHVGKQSEKKELVKEINEQNSRLAKARELLLSDAIDSADYKAIKTECERKLHLLEARLSSTAIPKNENIEAVIEKALYNLAHIDDLYQQADINSKRRIIGSIYPEKLQFENNSYRTTRINEAVLLICKLEAVLGETKTGQNIDLVGLSEEVMVSGVEP